MTLSEATHNPEILATLALFAAGAALAGAMVILERRPKTELKVRLLPTTPFLIAGSLATIWALMHILAVLGYHPPAR